MLTKRENRVNAVGSNPTSTPNIGNVVYIGSSIVDCGSTGEGSIPSVPSLNRAYNHALTPESYHRLSKESSIVKEIGDHKPLVQCLTLTTPTFSILNWIYGTPKIISAYPCTLNYTIEIPDDFNHPKGQWNFL